MPTVGKDGGFEQFSISMWSRHVRIDTSSHDGALVGGSMGYGQTGETSKRVEADRIHRRVDNTERNYCL